MTKRSAELSEVNTRLAATMRRQRGRGMHDTAESPRGRARPLLAPLPGGAALSRARGFHGGHESNGG